MLCSVLPVSTRVLEISAMGPIHTIAEAENGYLYYSDELGHAITCLDEEGRQLWSRGGGEFKYPKGIFPGWIHIDGERKKCLAIADSWHRRICFLSLTGELLTIWNAAAQSQFNEISDVRFHNDGISSFGMWLVLDSGNHRVCSFSEKGEFLSQILKPCFYGSLDNSRMWLWTTVFTSGICIQFPSL